LSFKIVTNLFNPFEQLITRKTIVLHFVKKRNELKKSVQQKTQILKHSLLHTESGATLSLSQDCLTPKSRPG